MMTMCGPSPQDVTCGKLFSRYLSLRQVCDSLQISKVEHAAIVEGLRDPPLREISIGGRKYRCTMSTLDMILGTARSVASDAPKGSGSGGGSGGAGCIIRTTNMAVIVAEHGPARSGHDEVLRGVDEFAGYLIRMGY